MFHKEDHPYTYLILVSNRYQIAFNSISGLVFIAIFIHTRFRSRLTFIYVLSALSAFYSIVDVLLYALDTRYHFKKYASSVSLYCTMYGLQGL